MIPCKSVHFRSSRGALPLMVAAALPILSGAGKPAFASTPQSGTSKDPVLPVQHSMTLKCQIAAFTTMTGDSQTIKNQPPPALGALTFTVLDDQLALVGPAGADRLNLLSTNLPSASMYFEETTREGSVVLWSFHSLQNKRVLFTGQLSINRAGKVEIWTQAGYCDASGGDGVPIRK